MSFDASWFRTVIRDTGPSIAELAEGDTVVSEPLDEPIPPEHRDLYEREVLNATLFDKRADDDSLDAVVRADADAAGRRKVREAVEAARVSKSSSPARPETVAQPSAQVAALRAELERVMAAPGSAVKPIAATAGRVAGTDNLEPFVSPWSTEPKGQRPDRFAVGTGRYGIFPTGCLSVVAAPGGHMKTTFMGLVCEHLAVGAPLAGFPVTRGASLFVSLEEDAEDMSRRLGAIAAKQFAAELHEDITRNVGLVAMPGQDGRFTEKLHTIIHASDMVPRLIQQAHIHAKRTGLPVRLIVIDHARLAICGDVNDSEMVTALTRVLTRVAAETGAAVVLLAHSPKSSLNPNREDDFGPGDILGSGASVDNARFAAVMFPLTAGERKKFGIDPEAARRYVAMRVIKSNFSEAGRVIYMRKVHADGWDTVVPELVELTAPTPEKRSDDGLDRRILAFVGARPGQYTVTQLAKNCAGSDGPMQAGRPAIKTAVERLLDAGRLALRMPSADDRAASGTSGRARLALFVGTVEAAT